MIYRKYRKKIKNYVFNEKNHLSAFLMWVYYLPKCGPLSAYRHVSDKKLFDMHFRINTNSVTKIDDHDYKVRNSNEKVIMEAEKVQSSSIHRYNLAIDFLKKTHQGDFRELKFIDIGSGKGRVLILAKQTGFKEVTGVELSYSMIQIANQNLIEIGFTDVLLIECNAGEYELPQGQLVLYLFNPFGSNIVSKIISRILNHKDLVYLIYSNPVHKNLFNNNSRIIEMYPENKNKDRAKKKLKIYKFIPKP